MKATVRSSAIVLTLALVAAACSGNGPEAGDGEPVSAVQHIHGLAVSAEATAYVATHAGLIRSNAQGWVYAGGNRDDHMGFVMDPRSGRMWRSGHSFRRPSLGVETSVDAGKTWRPLSDVLDPPVDFHAMTVSHADALVLYGFDSGGRGLFRSTDGGKGWTKLRSTGLADPRVLTLSAPAARDVVLAGTPSGLFRSADRGETWAAVPVVEGEVTAVAGDPSDGARVVAAVGAGILRSNDGGATWQGVPAPPVEFIGALAIDPTEGRTLYAAAAKEIFRSRDDGATWTKM